MQCYSLKSAYKKGSTVTCVPCMLEHACYELFSLKEMYIWKISYVNWLIELCVLSEIHESKTRFKQINENVRSKV